MQQRDEFIFKNGPEKIILKLDNGTKYLTWGKLSILNLKLENINPNELFASAPGINSRGNWGLKDEINLEIIPNKEILESDTLKLNIGYSDKDENLIQHQFLILIKP